RDPVPLRLGEIRQDEGMHDILMAGMADAEPYAHIIVADGRRDRAQAVMAGIAATRLYAEFGRRQIQLVVEDDDVGKPDLVETGRLCNGAARFVHVGFRLQKKRLYAADLAFGDLARKTRAPGREVPAPRDRVD